MEFLKQLKVGDKVLVFGRYAEQLRKVKKITKTMIILDNDNRFNLKSGHAVGAGIWDTTHLSECTPENMATFYRKFYTAKIVQMINNHYLEHFSNDELASLYETLKNKTK